MTTTTTTTAMERKAAAFVVQFSTALFTQWTSQRAPRAVFWADAAALRHVLEEGVAKLPRTAAIKAYLTRELARFTTDLRVQLQRQHDAYERAHAEQTDDEERAAAGPTLLNEEDVERALASDATSTAHVRAVSVLALGEKEEEEEATAALDQKTLLLRVEQAVEQLRVLQARGFEDAETLAHKSAYQLRRIRTLVEVVLMRWMQQTHGRWTCDATEGAAMEREQLRVLLQAVVTTHLVTAATVDSRSAVQPWTVFFRPQEPVTPRTLGYDQEMAKIYGALLALALRFPLVPKNEDDQDSESESETSADSEQEMEEKTRTPSKATVMKPVDAVAWATTVARQVVLAAHLYSDLSEQADWFVAVLSAFQQLPQPTRYLLEDEDEDDEDASAVGVDTQRALHNCLADLYTRTFTSAATTLWQARQTESDGGGVPLLEAVLCLRHASEFLRLTRKQSEPVVTQAAGELTAVPLPRAFWRWMAHVKKIYVGEHAVVQRVMKSVTRHQASRRPMASVLLTDRIVTLEELRTLVERFAEFVQAESDKSQFVVAPQGKAALAVDADTDEVAFFVDNVGGKSKSKSKSKGKSPDAEMAKRKSHEGDASEGASTSSSANKRKKPRSVGSA